MKFVWVFLVLAVVFAEMANAMSFSDLFKRETDPPPTRKTTKATTFKTTPRRTTPKPVTTKATTTTPKATTTTPKPTTTTPKPTAKAAAVKVTAKIVKK